VKAISLFRASTLLLFLFGCSSAASPDALAQHDRPGPPTSGALAACLAGMAPGTWKDAAKCVDDAPTLWSVAYQNVPNPRSPLTYNARIAAHIRGVGGADAIMYAWSGGIYDSRDRWIVVGNAGNHQSYFGNELYAFELSTLRWTRLDDPSSPEGYRCKSVYMPDGNPVNAHTYGSVSYYPPTNSWIQAMLYASDVNGCPDEGAAPFIEAFDLTAKKWHRLFDYSDNQQAHCLSPDMVTGYDPSDEKLYITISDAHCTSSVYDFRSGKFAAVPNGGHLSDYHMSGAVEPGVMLVAMSRLGFNALRFDGSGMTAPTTTGDRSCQDYFGPGGQTANGIQWDAAARRFVSMVPGTRKVCLLDPKDWHWTVITMGGDVPSPECGNCNGVFGRFIYDPEDDCLLYVGGVREHVFIGKKNW
jgi:hypothetical protein